MVDNLSPVREIIQWSCRECGDGHNYTAIPTQPDIEYACQHCQETTGPWKLVGKDWKLERSVNCAGCNGTSIVFSEDIKACDKCAWTEEELAFEPGTMVLFVPRQAKNNPHHSSVESGVIVKRAIRLDCVFVCYAAKDGMEGRAKLTKKTDLYLHRWASPEWAQDFLKSREET